MLRSLDNFSESNYEALKSQWFAWNRCDEKQTCTSKEWLEGRQSFSRETFSRVSFNRKSFTDRASFQRATRPSACPPEVTFSHRF